MAGYKTLEISIFSFIILAFIFIDAYKRTEKPFLHYKIFMLLMITNGLITVTDVLSWAFGSYPGPLYYTLNIATNTLLYIFNYIGYILWVAFIHSLVYQTEKTDKKLKIVLTSILAVHCLVTVSSIFTGWYFYVDAANVYHRGPFFWVYAATGYALMFYTLSIIYLNRRRILKRYFNLMFLFAVPQVLGGLVQALFLGISLSASGMTLSLLIIYFNMQSRSISEDHLTGLDNRRQMDGELERVIRRSIRRKKCFSAILLDLDSFKQINDTYGHDVGDQALKDTAMILRKSIKDGDAIARYGGDEFFIILHIQDKQELEQAVGQLRAYTARFNKESKKIYNLSFCIGYDVYDYKTPLKPQDFIRHLDQLMYQEKQLKTRKSKWQNA